MDNIGNINDKRLRKVRRVRCYDKHGNYLKTYLSIMSAARDLNLDDGNIVSCCKGRRISTGNFQFRYEE